MTEEGFADPNIDVDISGDSEGDVGTNNDYGDDANDDDDDVAFADMNIFGDGSIGCGDDVDDDDDVDNDDFNYESHLRYDHLAWINAIVNIA